MESMNIDYLWIFLMSMAPIWELRGTIPMGIYLFHLHWHWVFLVALAGNIVPIPFIILFLEPVTSWLRRIKFMDKVIGGIFERTRRKGRLVEKYEKIGLMLFVAIPLPGTGAWTGSLLAFLMGIKLKNAFLPIAVGVLIAGIIITILCLLGWIGALIAGVTLAILAILGLWRL